MKTDNIRTKAEYAILATNLIALSMSLPQVIASNASKTIDLIKKLNVSKFLILIKISSVPKIPQKQFFTSRTDSANSEECHAYKQTKMEHADTVFQFPFI